MLGGKPKIDNLVNLVNLGIIPRYNTRDIMDIYKENRGAAFGGAPKGAAPSAAPPWGVLLFDFPRNFSQVQFWADA